MYSQKGEMRNEHSKKDNGNRNGIHLTILQESRYERKNISTDEKNNEKQGEYLNKDVKF